MLVVATWLPIRDVRSHTGLRCCLLMSTKISLCLCCSSNMHRMNAAGIPPDQTETPHLNNDSLALNNASTVGLNSATTTCCFTDNRIHGVTHLSQMRGAETYGDKYEQNNNNNNKNSNINMCTSRKAKGF